MKKLVSLLLVLSLLAAVLPLGVGAEATRTIVDSMEREVELPETVERVVCVGVGALRYSCYVGAADRVVGVEDYETKPGMTRLYQYVNFDRFQNLPVTEEDNPVGNFLSEAHFVGHNHHGHALLGEFAHNAEHVADHFGVERTGGFVEQHDFGLHCQCPGNGHTLLLSAG